MKCKLYGWVGVLAGCWVSLPVSAKCGGVDYSWGAEALALMHDFVVTMMLYVPKVLNKAECRRRKLNELYDKINCFSMIYGQNGNYNLS